MRRDDFDALFAVLYTIQHIKYINIRQYLILIIMTFMYFLLIILYIVSNIIFPILLSYF